MKYDAAPRWNDCKSVAYERYIREQPCFICKKSPSQLHHVDRARNNASLCIPLCGDHHLGTVGAYHNRAVSKFKERAAFEKLYKINLDHVCLNYLADFLNQE